ncbi:hypothetical protein scyTo_0001677 [Scyliorhinus torazame]|uniref:ATP synthase subunit n=1 Tax=Scyliorhinus torazame TaxID=75743 RepID=A0A401PF12_SCYTO|nr:hypothetical protein [Scyliorhinus torazame]
MAEAARRLVQKVVTEGPKLALVAVESFKKLVASYKAGQYKHATVKDAVRNALVATEIVMWFYIGEVIGRGSLIGYNV